MRKNKIIFALVLVGLLLFSGISLAMTVDELMKKVDDYQFSKSVKMEAEMIIVNGSRQMTKNMLMYSKENSALIEFTNPRDRGSKFLKIEDNLWMFFPDAEEVVKISGHMLEQGLMGSDFSYQDAMEEEKLTDLYDFTILREEEIDGQACYVVEGVMKEGVSVSYYRRVSWIDQERFVIMKEELYAQSGRLLKYTEIQKVEEFDGRWYATESVMENKLKKNTQTKFKVISIEFDVEISDDLFSLENL